MNRNVKILAVSLMLASGSASAAFQFGDAWKLSGVQQCNVISGKKIIRTEYPVHTGVDYMAKAGTKVTVTGNLFFYKTHLDSSGWRYFVIACTIVKNGVCDNTNKSNVYYTFLHLEAAKLTAGQSLKNVVIGTVATVPSSSHVHYSKRPGIWADVPGYNGKLYSTSCNDPSQKSMMQHRFPENFVDPGAPLFKFN